MKLYSAILLEVNGQWSAQVVMDNLDIITFWVGNEEQIPELIKRAVKIIQPYGSFPIMVKVNPADQFCFYVGTSFDTDEENGLTVKP